MKKLALALSALCTLLCASSYAQWNGATGTDYSRAMYRTGNVGIGNPSKSNINSAINFFRGPVNINASTWSD
jgi:hypothetical protein